MERYTVTVDEMGTIRWYKEGTDIFHRVDGPAIEWADGTKLWFVDGKRHRLDGPAIEYPNMGKYWYIEDKEYTEEDFLKKTVPKTELTVSEIEELLGYPVKIVKE